jgi:hypothetical protein
MIISVGIHRQNQDLEENLNKNKPASADFVLSTILRHNYGLCCLQYSH